MAISYAPKVGEVLECNFGIYKQDDGVADERNYDGRIPPEMIKSRMVVVLNGKLGRGCLVVAISSTEFRSSIRDGVHVPLSPDLFRVTNFYDKRDRWAKADTIQQVSRNRLFKMKDKDGIFDHYLPRETVTEIQKAVIKSISANTLLTINKD